MPIDTILIKASYDLKTPHEALQSMVAKIRDDESNKRALQTIKLSRFNNLGFDFIKFNFPVCGNLSSTDLLALHSTMNGFDVYVVGNEETRIRMAAVSKIAKRPITFIPELDTPALHDPHAHKKLSFVNTQQRGYDVIFSRKNPRLVLEIAGDLPLLFDTYHHALWHDQDADLVMNLNNIGQMKQHLPSFNRNAYDRLINSKGEDVYIKEGNIFAQSKQSVAMNKKVFEKLYANRNAGKYLNLGTLLIPTIARLTKTIGWEGIKGFGSYLSQRRDLPTPAPYAYLYEGANALFKGHIHVDATNEDIAACWDLDGLNNDYVAYKQFFDTHFNDLATFMPHADEIYKLDEILSNTPGIMTKKNFPPLFNTLLLSLNLQLGNDILDLHLNTKGQLLTRENPVFQSELEQYLKEVALPRYHQSKERYQSTL